MRSARAVAVGLCLMIAFPASASSPVPLLRLTQIANLAQPLALTSRAGDDRLFVTEQRGRVQALDGTTVTTVLDISAEVSQGNEQGLLGLVFSPDGQTMFIDFTDAAGRTHVTAFEMSDDAPEPSSRSEILIVEQPFANHNGGHLAFGPDGHLYISLGDGGSAGDPQGNGQRLDTLLGKILRIEPRPGEDPPYAIPPDNPFVGVAGAREEIWAFGLRNPWRFSFDRLTGDLWIGDVGQNMWEEVDRAPALSDGGENYGWDQMEGTHPYDDGIEPADHVPPVYEYAHVGVNCSVTGGYVYRGTRIPALQGIYVFADFCAARLSGLIDVAGLVTAPVDLGVAGSLITSFGEDAAGELYVLSRAGPVWRLDPAA